MKRRYRIEVFQGDFYDDQWYWRLCSANDRTVADGSEGYSSKAACIRAVRAVQRNFPMDAAGVRVVEG